MRGQSRDGGEIYSAAEWPGETSLAVQIPTTPWLFKDSMKIHQLRALVAVSDSGGVRHASRLLGISPAAVTKSMRELEDQVKVQLFVRETSGITLTAAGTALLRHSQLVLTQLESATDEMSQLAGSTQTRLSVAIPAWMSVAMLGPILRKFEAEMPATRLELYESLRSVTIPGLRNGSIDLSINRTCPPPLNEEFEQTPLFTTGYAVVGRAGHPLARNRRFSQLKDATWVLAPNFDGPQEEERSAIAEFFRRNHPRIHVAHSSTIALSIIANTDTLGLMPWPLAELWVAKEGLCVLPVQDDIPEIRVSIMRRRGKPISRCAEVFLQSVTRTIQEFATSTAPEHRRFFHSLDCILD